MYMNMNGMRVMSTLQSQQGLQKRRTMMSVIGQILQMRCFCTGEDPQTNKELTKDEQQHYRPLWLKRPVQHSNSSKISSKT